MQTTGFKQRSTKQTTQQQKNNMSKNQKASGIPIELENGKISGQAVTNPTFEQYQISVGKVWKIMEDGRAWIAVKIG